MFRRDVYVCQHFVPGMKQAINLVFYTQSTIAVISGRNDTNRLMNCFLLLFSLFVFVVFVLFFRWIKHSQCC